MATNTSPGTKQTSSLEESGGKEVHILVIRLSAMGDVAMLVPVLRAVTKKYPHLKITILTKTFFQPIFKGIPNVFVYGADLKGKHSGFPGLLKLAGELRKLNFNAVADVHNVIRSKVLATIFSLFGITVKKIDKGRAEKKGLTAENNKIFKQLKTSHQRYADVFAALGYPVELTSPNFPLKQQLSEKTLDLTGKNNLKWVGIAPFAQHQSKVYPFDLMEKVIAELNKEDKIQIFLFGGGDSEIKILNSLASRFSNVISIGGKLKFEEELELISNLDLMLSMDSGNAHLSAMYGVPVITLWGVTHPFAGFSAYNQPEENHLLPDLQKYPKIPTSVYGNKVPEGYEDVMRSIPPDEVVEKVKSPLAPEGGIKNK